MRYEKSCGAVVYLMEDGKTKILLLKHKHGGHWSFPKGHVEQGENEYETAKREIKEETGLDVEIKDGFRYSVRYCPRQDTSKLVVYFLGEAFTSEYQRQEEEISEICWVDIDNSEEMITFKNDKNIVNKVKEYLGV